MPAADRGFCCGRATAPLIAACRLPGRRPAPPVPPLRHNCGMPGRIVRPHPIRLNILVAWPSEEFSQANGRRGSEHDSEEVVACQKQMAKASGADRRALFSAAVFTNLTSHG